ncbi:DUF1949 domain-containing protein [Siphonobacter curvatus]|uniref:Uncharacterized protein n=1 Tax=Siphonobacter curvatus TaxID=2094562 RepID=A0A2S7IHA9_9BACT|nr:DUF1949 domain-containing protein [Siphonobacter curvatus]PQA55048.1 hypothetical protein C5O19_21120 [Siphonobacter curvatus]
MRLFSTGISLFVLFTLMACSKEQLEPVIVDPPVPITVKLVARDTIRQGSYEGVEIHSFVDEAYTVLEQHRQQKSVTYLSAVNTYFSDLTDLKNRLRQFDWLTLDESYDTDSGVQIELAAGKVKSLTLNNRRSLSQWPEAIDSKSALQVGDTPEQLYSKLVELSKKPAYATKFQKMVLTSRYSYAIYDPVKARLPWTLVYPKDNRSFDQVQIHFQDKQVAFITVERFEPL